SEEIMSDISQVSRRRFLQYSAAAATSLGFGGSAAILPARAATTFAPVAEEEAVIAFAYVGPVSDEGWTWVHDQGRKAIEEAFPKARTIFVENVPYSADATRTIRQFVAEGA